MEDARSLKKAFMEYVSHLDEADRIELGKKISDRLCEPTPTPQFQMVKVSNVKDLIHESQKKGKVKYVGLAVNPPVRLVQHMGTKFPNNHKITLLYAETSNMKESEGHTLKEIIKHKIEVLNDKNQDGTFKTSSKEAKNGYVFVLVVQK